MITVDSNMILGLAVIFGVLIVCLIGMFASFLFTLRRETRVKRTELTPDKITEEAGKKSVKILEDAHKKAREILSEAKGFSDRSESIIQKEAQKSSELYLGIYENAVNQTKLEAIKTIQNIPEDVKNSVDDLLTEFNKELNFTVTEAQKKMDKNILELNAKYQEELGREKQLLVSRLEEKIVRIVSKIVEESIGKSMSDVEHEKLILKSLDQAKKEGAFEDL